MSSQYCQPADLAGYAINPNALINIGAQAQINACVAASEKADSYMRGRYTLPLLSWGQDVTIHTAYIAVYLLMAARGYSPTAGSDEIIRARYEDAIKWFEGIQRQSVHPDVTPSVPSVQDKVAGLPQVFSDQQRGWQQYNNSGVPKVS